LQTTPVQLQGDEFFGPKKIKGREAQDLCQT
jgi:hypothetical protein